ncbi:MAG: hypothetical protein M3167_06285 [Acidobacteriota bacterium]|nr:hypothetical protein [Acidobacteriota bacterium]MDQ6892272.1 hypothetical protein [Acidobacteriota bacterium]
MANTAQDVVEKVTSVARQVAKQQSLTVEGTVTGINPDGTLVVDDGQGGCARQAPKQHAKIGDRIVLGTEPALGTVTNLPQLNITLDPSTKACPTDPRTPPTDRRRATYAAGTQILASAGIADWTLRDVDQGNGLPADCSTWFGYKKTSANTVSTSDTVLANYRREVVGACAHTLLYSLARSFVKFDLAANGVSPGARHGRIKFSVKTPVVSAHNINIYLVPASLVFPITVPQMNAFSRNFSIGNFAILGGWATGPNTYGLTVELDLSILTATGPLPDPFVVALLTSFDYFGDVPGLVHPLIDNEDINDVFNFYSLTADGPPILELDVPLY